VDVTSRPLEKKEETGLGKKGGNGVQGTRTATPRRLTGGAVAIVTIHVVEAEELDGAVCAVAPHNDALPVRELLQNLELKLGLGNLWLADTGQRAKLPLRVRVYIKVGLEVG